MTNRIMELAAALVKEHSTIYKGDVQFIGAVKVRAALEAEIDRVVAERDAQRKVLEQALEALKWFDYDEQWQSSNRPHWFVAAITAIQEQLHEQD